MMVEVENRKRFIPPDKKLSSREADAVASTFIALFKVKLNSLEEFRQVSPDGYLNISGNRNYAIKKSSGRFRFFLGIDEYGVEDAFSDKEQSFVIVKNTFRVPENEGGDPVFEKTDVITLKSSRFIRQKPIRKSEVGWHYPVGNKFYDPDIPNPQTNTPFAVEKILEMFEGLSSQAPQK